ncbi:MAG TPA: TrkA family potassium uptake protein [Candidatus Sulfotelmatobacter sp.]|nr:TrkA family potassium uptake protein [Candidatus Sulfotelmatobacter sp.]
MVLTRSIVVGCGRVGAGIAEHLARAGHEVVVVDISTEAFARLEPDFPGTAVRGDGTDEAVLRRAGTEGADFFFALTEGDNRNILSAQLAEEIFAVPHVVAKINDPVRAEAYTALGVSTLCRTTSLVDDLGRYAGLPPIPGAGGVRSPSGHHDHAQAGVAPAQPPSPSPAMPAPAGRVVER